MIHTDKGLNRVPANSIRPINSYVLVLKLLDPKFYNGASKILVPDSFKSGEYGIGIAMSSYEKIEVGHMVIYGKHNTTDGLDDILFVPPDFSSMLEISFEGVNLASLASYNKQLCSFSFIHSHGLFALITNETVHNIKD